MEEKSTTNPIENRRVLSALAASIKSLEPKASRTIKENSDQKNISLIIDVLTAVERKKGLHVAVFKLVALAKKAIVSGNYAEYWEANARFEGLIG
jgi:hypothetical protein